MADPIRVVPAGTGGPPERKATFESKSARKARRKMLVRGYVKNAIDEARLNHGERAAFYKRLRVMKIRRRQIAADLRALAIELDGLVGEVRHVEDRYRIHYGLIEEPLGLAKQAATAAGQAADEFYAFSRNKIFFTVPWSEVA
jgi:hypothetical protein